VDEMRSLNGEEKDSPTSQTRPFYVNLRRGGVENYPKNIPAQEKRGINRT